MAKQGLEPSKPVGKGRASNAILRCLCAFTPPLTDEVLRQILPEGVSVPTSFEQVPARLLPPTPPPFAQALSRNGRSLVWRECVGFESLKFGDIAGFCQVIFFFKLNSIFQ